MTPEQIAESVVSGHVIKTLCPIANPAALTTAIIQAIRDAYERAAQIAAAHRSYDTTDRGLGGHSAAVEIERAIRALKGEAT